MSTKLIHCCGIIVLVLVFVLPQTATAQFVHSAFTEASVARLGLSGLGMNFALANPAILSNLPDNQRFILTLEVDHNNIETAFKDDLPDLSLQIVITSRITVALAQSKRAVPSQANANRGSRDDPSRQHPLRFLVFGHQQDWSAGIGVQLQTDLSLGLAVRHENYTVVPPFLGPVTFGQSFRTFDLGLRRSDRRLNAGLVLRNFVKNRTSKPITESLRFVNLSDPAQSFDWNPLQFNNVAFEPQFAVEGGAHWMAGSHWQLLGDVSSRGEYALGLRWRVFSKFFVTAGNGKRFDRIYADAAVTYTALGGQFQNNKFALGLAWIIPRRAGRNQIVSMPYGIYNLEQSTNNRLLISGALSL